MEMEQIRTLLAEAEDDDCTAKRREEILQELVEGRNASPTVMTENEMGAWRVLCFFYQDLAENRPDRMMSQLPIFVALCGDRSNTAPVAKGDWDQIGWSFERNYLGLSKDQTGDS